MKQISIPLKGLASKPGSPAQLVGYLKDCRNWLCWKGMVCQPTGYTIMANAANVHSALFYRDSNSNAYVIYTDGRDIKSVTADNNLTGANITVNEFAATAGNKAWPIDRFYKHIMFGSDHDGLHFYYPPSYNNNLTGKAGIAAPANAATVAAGAANGITGVYKLVYTFVNERGHESAPSPASNSQCVTNAVISWSNIEAGPAGTTQRKLYRTVNDGGLYLYLTTLNDNTTTDYNDTTSDTSLGAEVDYEGSDVPPTIIRSMCVAGPRLYLLDNSSVIWACKIDSQTSLPNWEAYPSALSTTIPAGEGSDDVQAIFSLDEVVFAATRHRIFKLLGDPYTGQQVIKVADVGMFNRYSWCYVDSDRGSVYFLTSNYKVVKMDANGNWKELSESIINLLQTITNYKAPDLGDSIEMTHDASKGLIHLNCAISGVSNNTTLILDLESGRWSQVDYGYMLSLISDTSEQLIGYKKGASLVWHNNNNNFLVDSANSASYFNNQTFQTYPFFIPDKHLQVSRIGIVCRALPLSSYIPPMLKVEWAQDNNDRWTSKFVDVSNINRRLGASGNTQVSQEAITVFVPVHATVSSISVKISATQNVAALQGFEIYDVFLEVEEAEEADSNEHHIDRDKR